MEIVRIRMLLNTIARESSTRRLLRDELQRIQQKFGLTDDELNALRSADLLRASELHMQQSNGGSRVRGDVPHGADVELLDASGTWTIVPPSYINDLDVPNNNGTRRGR